MNGKIIFVDDETDILKALERLFMDEPYDVATFSCPLEALEWISHNGSDVVVSDQKMPKMDGATFLKKVRERCPDAVRIIMSGQVDFDAAVSAINQGNVYRFIQKPWDDASLKLTIEKAVALHDLIFEHQRLFDLIRIKNTELCELNRNVEDKVGARTEAIRQNEQKLKYALEKLRKATGGVSEAVDTCLRLFKEIESVLK